MDNLVSKYTVQKILRENDLSPNNNFGQNFLISSKSLKKILNVIGEDDLIIEIGSGLGTLTERIARKARKIVAVEVDKKLIPVLQKNLDKFKNIEFVNLDALKFNPSKCKYTLCGNVPYNISSPLIRRFLIEVENKPQKIVFLVQKEFAEKITSKKSSLLKILVEVFGTAKIRGNVKKECFYPKPKIDSAILEIIPFKKSKIQKKDFDVFFKILEAGFGERRKKLVNNLSKFLEMDKDLVKAKLKEISISENIRGDALSVQNWLDIFTKLR